MFIFNRSNSGSLLEGFCKMHQTTPNAAVSTKCSKMTPPFQSAPNAHQTPLRVGSRVRESLISAVSPSAHRSAQNVFIATTELQWPLIWCTQSLINTDLPQDFGKHSFFLKTISFSDHSFSPLPSYNPSTSESFSKHHTEMSVFRSPNGL